MEKNMDQRSAIPVRHSAGGPRIGNFISVLASIVFATIAVGACSLPDHRVLSACRIDPKTNQYDDYQSCLRAREQVSNEKDRAAENKRRNEQDAFKRKFDRDRRAGKLKPPKPLSEKQLAAQKKRKLAWIADDTRQAVKRWNSEIQSARKENSTRLQNHPNIAWLNGIWCASGYAKFFQRIQVTRDGKLRVASFFHASGGKPAQYVVRFDLIRLEKNLYITWQKRAERRTVGRIGRQRPNTYPYTEYGFRKVDGNTYERLWHRSVSISVKPGTYDVILKPGRRYHEKKRLRFKRCAGV